MDSNLDNLQTMLTNHGFSVDTSALLDVSPTPPPAPPLPAQRHSLTALPSLQLFSPSVTVPDMSLPDLDSSLASVRRWEQGGGRVGSNRALTVPSPPCRSRSSSPPRSPPGPLRQRAAAPTQVSRAPPPLHSGPTLARALTWPPPPGKQLVQYTAQPLFLLDPGSVDVGSSDLPVLFELGEGPYFSEGEDYTDDPISLLTGSEPPRSKDPTVS